jgi:hypothetical protein
MLRVTRETFLWTAAFAVVIAFAVPWFLWRSDAVIGGLPVWLWWHVGWMGVTALVFRAFAKHAWGLGVRRGERA